MFKHNDHKSIFFVNAYIWFYYIYELSRGIHIKLLFNYSKFLVNNFENNIKIFVTELGTPVNLK